MFTRKAKDNRKTLFWGTNILTFLGIIWARIKDVEIALSLFELITINKIGNNTMAYLDILLILILGGLILGTIHLWYKSKDEKAKRDDFIKTIKKLHSKQTALYTDLQNSNDDLAAKKVTEINKLLKKLELHKTDEILDKIRADEINKRIEK